MPCLKEGALLPSKSKGFDVTFGLGVNDGLVLPTGKRLLGGIAVGLRLLSFVGGLVEFVGTELPPEPTVGLLLLMDDGENETEVVGNLVDGVIDALCGLGINDTGSPYDGCTEVNKVGLEVIGSFFDGILDALSRLGICVAGSPEDGGTEERSDGLAVIDGDDLLGKYVGESIRSTTRLVQYTSSKIAPASTLTSTPNPSSSFASD